jgi:hypothetical protein
LSVGRGAKTRPSGIHTHRNAFAECHSPPPSRAIAATLGWPLAAPAVLLWPQRYSGPCDRRHCARLGKARFRSISGHDSRPAARPGCATSGRAPNPRCRINQPSFWQPTLAEPTDHPQPNDDLHPSNTSAGDHRTQFFIEVVLAEIGLVKKTSYDRAEFTSVVPPPPVVEATLVVFRDRGSAH